MFYVRKPAARLFTATAAALTLLAGGGAWAQVEVLRESDDQFIQGLREQGMSDLLERFIEIDPPTDPIARLALDVALQEFIAQERRERAVEASNAGDYASYNALVAESRQAYESVLDAQRKLVAEHGEDERLPLWQTDLAQMLLFTYLPVYFNQAEWVVEFGLPTDEQAAAYADAMIEALTLTAEARYRLDELPNRVAANAGLRPKLEEMGIWYKLDDYGRLNTPYWLGRAAHGVSLLPDAHPYFATKRLRGQRDTAPQEKTRLRGVVIDAFSGSLIRDARTKATAQLYCGRTLVQAGSVEQADEGVDDYLDPLITGSADTIDGFLATLAKAVGRKQAGELDVALGILGGMDRHPFVRQDATPFSRLLSADLTFRLLDEVAQQTRGPEKDQLVAEAYEQAYLPLLDSEDTRYRTLLFTRWADSAGDVQDPAKLPPAVRMGIGEQLTGQGVDAARMAIALAQAAPQAIPSEADAQRREIQQKRDQARQLLDRAALFNQTLTGEDTEGALLARALFNLGMDKYWLAELSKAFEGEQDWQPYFEAARLWLAVGQRAPDAEQARSAVSFSVGFTQQWDYFFNRESVTQPLVRDAYRSGFEIMAERYPQDEATQANRVYAGYYLYEKAGELGEAVEVYRALPSAHKDYFAARRQLIYALQRQYRKLSDELRLALAAQPPSPGVDATAEQRAELAQQKLDWEKRIAAIQEELDRQRGDVTEDAQLIILDAEEERDNGTDPARRFEAATALGAARVVLAGMEADEGKIEAAMSLLEGFEADYSPAGELGDLAALQQDPEAAKANLQGLIQTAQEQRILALLDAGQTDEMVRQARAMMDASPDVAATVVTGVLDRIEATIDRERRAARDAAFQIQRDEAQAKVKSQAQGAVALGKLLVEWALGRGYDESKMVGFRLPLAESLLLADDAEEALAIMAPIAEAFPNDFRVAITTGRANLGVFRQKKDLDHYNGAMDQFKKIINYYNVRPEKPDRFWEAWMNVCLLLEAHSKQKAGEIPGTARILLRIDEELGGPAFKDRFYDIFERNGGIERLPRR